jgi:UDP-N-acetylmuramoyl-tripeptide--D-alanyl-D-alanine ligase
MPNMNTNEQELKKLYEIFLQSTGVSTDTRKIEHRQVFFCLKGPNFDANTFAQAALDAGALAVVSDDAANASITGVHLTENVLATLQGLARYHRRQMPAHVLAITGSNGKTTTKELVREALVCKYRVYATEGNLNNHIGVPLTLLRIRPETEIAIVEMGANAVGEIASYCLIAEPSYGMITNIGKAHLEGFGGVEGIIRGKTELFDWLRTHEGMVFLNGADRVLGKMKWRFSKVRSYGTAEDDFHCEPIDEAGGLRYRLPKYSLEGHCQLEGAYNLPNIAAALCIADYFEVPMPEAVDAIAAYQPQMQRSQRIQGKRASIILDAYNANPSSMAAALENLAKQPGKRWAILGDMYELGEDTDKEHTALLQMAMEAGIEHIVVCGAHFMRNAAAFPQVQAFADKDALRSFLRKQAWEGAVILIKGSRGMAMESLLDVIDYEGNP